jgi:uncharacterized protein (TIGR02145 family)
MIMKNIPSVRMILFCMVSYSILMNGCLKERPNAPPRCEILNPKDQSVFTVEDELDLRFTAWDTDGDIASIEVFLNGIQITTLDHTRNEFNFSLNDMSPGKFVLKLHVVDDQGEENNEVIHLTINPALPVFTDPRDGHMYHYVQIGDQTWMAENLAYLPTVDPVDRLSGSEPRYYVLNYTGEDVGEARNQETFVKHGVLYNWPAALTAPPEGWHLPSHMEWRELEQYIASEHKECVLCEEEGMEVGDGTYFRSQTWTFMTLYLLHTSGWRCDLNGLNVYGLSLLPCYPNRGFIESETTCQEEGYWWTATQTEYDEAEIWVRNILKSTDFRSFQLAIQTESNEADIRRQPIQNPTAFMGFQMSPQIGLSVRCIRDK